LKERPPGCDAVPPLPKHLRHPKTTRYNKGLIYLPLFIEKIRKQQCERLRKECPPHSGLLGLLTTVMRRKDPRCIPNRPCSSGSLG
jgi:hypothetical protein